MALQIAPGPAQQSPPWQINPGPHVKPQWPQFVTNCLSGGLFGLITVPCCRFEQASRQNVVPGGQAQWQLASRTAPLRQGR